MTLEVQALTMLHMIGAGMSLGALMDTYKRLFWKKKIRLLNGFQDILFWLICGVLIFMWLRMVNHGELRIVIFLSLLLGYAAYQALFQRSFQWLLEGSIRTILTVLGWITSFLYYCFYKPLTWLFSALLALVLFVFNLILKLFTFLSILGHKIKRGFFYIMAKCFKRKEK